MYLRRHTRKKNKTDYECWSLVESVRTLQGPRQRIVATLGKLPGMDKGERIGWEEIGRILDGKLLEELKEVKSMDILLPARDKTFRLRVVSTAPKELKVLLYRLGLQLPNKPKIMENVVQTFVG